MKNWKIAALSAALAISFVGGTPQVRGQSNWSGASSSDYFTAGNWSDGSLPATNANVVVASGATTVVNPLIYNGDNSATPTGTINIGAGGSQEAHFTMQSGTLVTGGPIRLGDSGNPVARWTQNGGTVTINATDSSGGFRISNASNSYAEFVMNDGLLDIPNDSGRFAVTTTNGSKAKLTIAGGEIRAGQVLLGDVTNNPNGQLEITMTGGAVRGRERLNLGRSQSSSPVPNSNMVINMSGGVMETGFAATGSEPVGYGTVRLLGGLTNLSGGVIRGLDFSSRNWGKIDFQGGVLEILTDLDEENVNGVTNRGYTRMYFVARYTDEQLGGSGLSTTARLITSLPDHFVAIALQVNDNSLPYPQSLDAARAFATLKGDVDNDLFVAGGDLLQWQREFGKQYLSEPDVVTGVADPQPFLGGDADGDADADADDLAKWASNFGRRAGSSVVAAGAVPEPTTAGLVLLVGVLAAAGRTRPEPGRA